MRGQALSSTRKLNKHWQSGEGGYSPLGSGNWFNCARYKGEMYHFPLRYTISGASTFPFNSIVKPIDLNNPPTYKNINKYTGIGNSYALKFPNKPFTKVWNYNSSTGTLGQYEIIPNVKLIPNLGNCPCSDDVIVYCHGENGQLLHHNIALPYSDDINTMSLIVDLVFLRTEEDRSTGDTRLNQSITDCKIPESMLSQFLTTPVMVPKGFKAIWQTSLFLDQYFYCYDPPSNQSITPNQLNLLAKTTETGSGTNKGLVEPEYRYTYMTINGKQNANNDIQVSPIFQGQILDIDNYWRDNGGPGVYRKAYSGVNYGYALPFCNGNSRGYMPGQTDILLAEDAWLRRLQTAAGEDHNIEFDYEHRNQNWIGYAVILRKIIPEKRPLC